MSCQVGVDYSVDKRVTWSTLGSTTNTGVVAFDGAPASLAVAPTFWLRVWWNPSGTKYYMYLPGLDFGDATVNHRLRKVELGLRDGGSNHTTFVDDITIWTEPIVERQSYLTVNILLEFQAHSMTARTPHRSVYVQQTELANLLDDTGLLETPTGVVQLTDAMGQKWEAQITNITERGLLSSPVSTPGLVVTIEFLLLRKV